MISRCLVSRFTTLSWVGQIDAVLKSSLATEEKVEKLRVLALNKSFEFPTPFANFPRQIAAILVQHTKMDPECIAACLKVAFPEDGIKNVENSGAQIEYPSFSSSSDLVEIVHGGGLEYIQRYINGESNGYVTEAQGKGIFVTPANHPLSDRAFGYATRTTIRYFQTPCVMKAKIPGNQLSVVNHNGYEAVILPKNRSALTDITYTTFPKDNPSVFRVIVGQNMPAGRVSFAKDGSIAVDYGSLIRSEITEDPIMVQKLNCILGKLASMV